MVRFAEPRLIQIDASAHCQLACPSCPTASGATRPGMGAGHLDPDRFRQMLDQNPWIAEVELSNYGEMFLNPRLIEILRIARDRDVVLHADNGTNLNHAHGDVLEALVVEGFRSLTVSIDGASPESYAQYRVKGDFDRVIGHIRRLNELKRKHRSGWPILTWQFIAFGHNEHEIETARKMAGELGMGFRTKMTWDDEVSPIRDAALVRVATRSPHLDRAAYREAHGVDPMRGICHQLWHAPVLNWDGRVMGCCRNFWSDFGGNAFTEGVMPVLTGERIAYARRMLTGNAAERPDIPCTTCDLYRTLKETRRWLTSDELRVEANSLLSVVVLAEGSPATHVDVFVTPGATVDPVLLARPPKATRFTVGKDHALYFALPGAGEYTVCALPKQLDPTFRRVYPPLPALTRTVTLAALPVSHQVLINLSGAAC
jgi:hypothetical protein